MIEHNVIGYTPDQPETEDSPAVQGSPGFHVNMTAPVLAELAEYEVHPATPMRVYGGVETVFLVFADEAQWQAKALELGIVDPVVEEPAE